MAMRRANLRCAAPPSSVSALAAAALRRAAGESVAYRRCLRGRGGAEGRACGDGEGGWEWRRAEGKGRVDAHETELIRKVYGHAGEILELDWNPVKFQSTRPGSAACLSSPPQPRLLPARKGAAVLMCTVGAFESAGAAVCALAEAGAAALRRRDRPASTLPRHRPWRTRRARRRCASASSCLPSGAQQRGGGGEEEKRKGGKEGRTLSFSPVVPLLFFSLLSLLCCVALRPLWALLSRLSFFLSPPLLAWCTARLPLCLSLVLVS